jgi:hypothetical protein
MNKDCLIAIVTELCRRCAMDFVAESEREMVNENLFLQGTTGHMGLQYAS